VTGEERPEPRLVAGPVAAAGVVLVAVGWWRDQPLAIAAGGVAIGAGLKLV
jgi:hypothetical protein